MVERFEIPPDASAEQIRMIVGALYLSLAYAIAHIAKNDDAASATAFKSEFITALRNGDIDMSILDDAKTFDFLIANIQRLVEDPDAPRDSTAQ